MKKILLVLAFVLSLPLSAYAQKPYNVQPLVLTEEVLATRPDLRARIDADHVEMAKAVVPATTWCSGYTDLQTGLIPVHQDHPQVGQMPFYTSSAFWRPISSQLHILHSDNVLSHTHAETCGPDFGKLPKTLLSLTLPGRVQFYHTDGGITGWRNGVVYGVHGDLLKAIRWDEPGIKMGVPNGVIIHNFKADYDLRTESNSNCETDTVNPCPLMHNGSGGPLFALPENGWFPGSHLVIDTDSRDGIQGQNELLRAFYVQGDPSIPDWTGPRDVSGFSFVTASRTTAYYPGDTENLGVSNVEFRDTFLPIAPLTTQMVLGVLSYNYARGLNYPGAELDRQQEVRNADLHAGNPGLKIQDLPANAIFNINLDPAQMGEGEHKIAGIWKQNTGTGNSFFGPNQEVWSLLVFDVSVPAGPYTPLLPSPSGTRVTLATPGKFIIDNAGNKWEISGSKALVFNGAQWPNGWGIGLLWENNTLSLLGMDNNWYVILGSGNPPPPPPPPTPVATPCVGVVQVVEIAPGTFVKAFVKTADPTNGGTPCSVVAQQMIGG